MFSKLKGSVQPESLVGSAASNHSQIVCLLATQSPSRESVPVGSVSFWKGLAVGDGSSSVVSERLGSSWSLNFELELWEEDSIPLDD